MLFTHFGYASIYIFILSILYIFKMVLPYILWRFCMYLYEDVKMYQEILNYTGIIMGTINPIV